MTYAGLKGFPPPAGSTENQGANAMSKVRDVIVCPGGGENNICASFSIAGSDQSS